MKFTPRQLTLPLKWLDASTFANFVKGDNGPTVGYLQERIEGPATADFGIYLVGGYGTGLTHLLSATCHALTQLGKSTIYLPLRQLQDSPQILEGVENLDWVCLDDIERVCGLRAWEEALFHCYNRLQLAGKNLLIASHVSPAQLPCGLPDLVSRLAASTILTVHPLADEEKIRALQLRAQDKGLELAPEAAHYLLHHYPRDTPALFRALEKLDEASFAAQRRLTVPFIKETL
ncbi:MAG: DnaA regulatory inactivator Hda [Gammaproteobacteria bacterium]